MVQHGGLIDGAGVVVQSPGDGQVHGEVSLRHAEGSQIFCHRVQLIQAQVKDLVPAPVALQGGQDLLVGAGDGGKAEDLPGLLRREAGLHQQLGHLVRADLVQLVHRAHDLAGLLGKTQHGVKAVEDLPVVHPDLEPLQSQGGEGLVDDGGDLCLIDDGEPAISRAPSPMTSMSA